jgi:hypothetical protein
VIACDKSLEPIYRRVNSYPHLVRGGIFGSPDDRRNEELRVAAEPLVASKLASSADTALAAYRDAVFRGLASDDVEKVLLASLEGRVRAVWIAEGVYCWGHLDPAECRVEVRQSPLTEDEDLLNLAATTTYLKGGAVYTRQAQEMPSSNPISALYRY